MTTLSIYDDLTSAKAPRRTFTLKLALAMIAVIAAGFTFSAIRRLAMGEPALPLHVHLHAAAMVGWLALLVAQSLLARQRNMALHRTLGFASLGWLAFMVGVACYTGYDAVATHRVPPFFTDAYFLSLVYVEILTFAALVGLAIGLRRRSDWHKRLMVGSTVILLEPAFGRLLPMPMLGAAGEWISLALQLGVVAWAIRIDRESHAGAHPAWLTVGGATVFTHVAVTWLAAVPAVIRLAQGIAAG